MIDRVRTLIREIAAEMAAHDGVPVGRVHIHAACGRLTALAMQARDGMMAPPAAAPRAAVAADEARPGEPAPIDDRPVEAVEHTPVQEAAPEAVAAEDAAPPAATEAKPE